MIPCLFIYLQGEVKENSDKRVSEFFLNGIVHTRAAFGPLEPIANYSQHLLKQVQLTASDPPHLRECAVENDQWHIFGLFHQFIYIQ